MKKNLLFLLVFLLLFLYGCVSPFLESDHPVTQPNSVWISEDERITFSVENESNAIYGVLYTKEKDIEIRIDMGVLTSYIFVREIGDKSDNTIKGTIEEWNAIKTKPDKFIVIVEKSDYYDKGTELVFYKKAS